MTMSGMNIAEIRSLASQLRRNATTVQQCGRNVDRLLQTAGNHWSGPDLSQVTAKWNGQTRGIAQRLEAELRELAATAERNADAQQVTSDELGDSSGGSGGGSGGGGTSGGDGGGGGGGGSWNPERDRDVSELDPFVYNPEKDRVSGPDWNGGPEWEGTFGDPDAGKNPVDDMPVNLRYDIADGEGVLFGVDASANGSVGNQTLGAQGEASAMAGIKGEYEVYATSGGFVAAAGIMAGAQASASGSAYAGPLTVAGQVEAMAGASADGSVRLGPAGVSVQGEAFAGAKAEASGSVDIAGVGVSGTAEGWAGIGIEARVDIGFVDGKLMLGGEFGAALGVGGSVGGGITIDVNKMADSLTGAADAIGDFFGGLW